MLCTSLNLNGCNVIAYISNISRSCIAVKCKCFVFCKRLSVWSVHLRDRTYFACPQRYDCFKHIRIILCRIICLFKVHISLIHRIQTNLVVINCYTVFCCCCKSYIHVIIRFHCLNLILVCIVCSIHTALSRICIVI